jgi:Flp pilus assembly protein TadD
MVNRCVSCAKSVRVWIVPAALLIVAASITALGQRPKGQESQTGTRTPTRSVIVTTEPNAIVWLDDVRRGVTDAAGRLALKDVSARSHTLRVRARGFAEKTLPLAASVDQVKVPLARTTDAAELAFQEAEEARGLAKTDDERRAAADLYRRALKLRPRFPAARVGLARVLLDLRQTDEALAEIARARRDRPVYPEASAVEGRILRAMADPKGAVDAYQRAIREGRGFQPEAYAGLGILYEEEGKYEEAARAYRQSLAQLADTEPIIYQKLGGVYEQLEKYKEAVEAYEKYLQLAPDGRMAPAIRSIIDQLKQQAGGRSGLPY